MNAKVVGFLLSVVVVPLVFTSRVLAGPPDQEDSAATRPKDVRKVVPPEEREAIGLNETTWTKEHGKVHPDVYKMLEKDERPWPRPVGYEGTVYVQMHLKHEQKGKAKSAENKAAIKDVQSKVLSQLTAAEFHVEYPFETVAGILGYVNGAGLEKVKANADVIAVCLDDKPMPKRPPHVTKADLPPLKPGDPSTQPAEGRFWGSGGKVEAEVYQALGLHDRVFVIVLMNETRAEGPLEEKIGKGRAIEERVLSTLTADEFWLSSRSTIRSTLSPRLTGSVNIEGLKKLENHADVRYVGLDSRGRTSGSMKRRP